MEVHVVQHSRMLHASLMKMEEDQKYTSFSLLWTILHEIMQGYSNTIRSRSVTVGDFTAYGQLYAHQSDEAVQLKLVVKNPQANAIVDKISFKENSPYPLVSFYQEGLEVMDYTPNLQHCSSVFFLRKSPDRPLRLRDMRRHVRGTSGFTFRVEFRLQYQGGIHVGCEDI